MTISSAFVVFFSSYEIPRDSSFQNCYKSATSGGEVNIFNMAFCVCFESPRSDPDNKYPIMDFTAVGPLPLTT